MPPASWTLGRRAVLVFAAALAVYWATALWAGNTHSPERAYFDRLAAAFLEGRLDIGGSAEVRDLTLHEGRWYVPFPPLPALLLLPWVALFGVPGTNTVLFSVLVASLGLAATYLFLETLAQRGWTRLDSAGSLWLTTLLGLGSVFWYASAAGTVWFLSQVCTVAFMALAAWLAAGPGSALLAGGALAFAVAARPHTALAFALLLGIAAERLRGPDGRLDRRAWVRWVVIAAVPIGLVVVGLLAYNAARFGNPLDFGYLQENVADPLAAELREHGQFNLRFVPRNLWTMWLAPPHWNAATLRIDPDPTGMGLLFTTPAILYVLRARRRSPLILGAWTAFGLLLVPLLLYYNTGWVQFGYRFSLDFMVPVVALLAVAAGERVSWPMRGLILLGVLVNLKGVRWWFG